MRELLPRNSREYQAFEKQLARAPRGATLLVLVQSDDRAMNLRFIEQLADKLQDLAQAPDSGLVVVDSNNRRPHAFFQANKWLYAPLEKLEEADAELGRAIAIETGLVEDLQGDVSTSEEDSSQRLLAQLQGFQREAERQLAKIDPFPTGHYEIEAGRVVGLRLISRFASTGDGGERLFAQVKQLAESTRLSVDAGLVVGFAGDIPNAIEEKRSVSSDAFWAIAAAGLLVLLGVTLFFRSFFAVLVIAMPVALGIGVAYAFATSAFGYVNTAGAFLGAIIMGNGINYPIVLLARYQDLKGRDMSFEVALHLAVRNAFRAELVGAAVAAIAYGSLVFTAFRGFNQFGAIGFVGMISVWLASIPLVPALIVLGQRHVGGRRLPGSKTLSRLGAWLLAHRWVPVASAIVVTIAFSWKLPSWLQDPWEYNFARLGSRQNKATGAGHWSKIADQVFGGRSRLASALMVAESPAQVALVAEAMLRNDKETPGQPMLDGIFTLRDVLPGSLDLQSQKLAVLARMQRRLKPAVIDSLPPEAKDLVKTMLPQHALTPIEPTDLPHELLRLFTERDGTLGTVFYVQTKSSVSLSNGRNLLRLDAVTNNVRLADGTIVATASRAGVFAEIFRSLNRDGPKASLISLTAVIGVVLLATHSVRGALMVLLVLLVGVVWMLGFAAWSHDRLNFLNFVALPITFGIGCEYPFNIFDRVRLLKGDIADALSRSGGAVALCSYTTVVGYGSLLLSDNRALQSFGRLAIAGEVACILGALFLLPALLGLWPIKPTALKLPRAT